eukprot:8387834-Pyramimonas_sp.AAC.1
MSVAAAGFQWIVACGFKMRAAESDEQHGLPLVARCYCVTGASGCVQAVPGTSIANVIMREFSVSVAQCTPEVVAGARLMPRHPVLVNISIWQGAAEGPGTRVRSDPRRLQPGAARRGFGYAPVGCGVGAGQLARSCGSVPAAPPQAQRRAADAREAGCSAATPRRRARHGQSMTARAVAARLAQHPAPVKTAFTKRWQSQR